MSRAEARISMRASSDALFVFNTPVSSNLYTSSSLVRRQLDKVQNDRGGILVASAFNFDPSCFFLLQIYRVVFLTVPPLKVLAFFGRNS